MTRAAAATWPIAQVAKMSGVSSRTLRHYDAIGLLAPAGTGAGGQRRYGRDELLRLQQILLLRELGLGLGAIAAILDRGGDPASVLRAHHARLLGERDRLDALARTVARTLDALTTTKADPMAVIGNPQNLFEGFDPARYRDEARERWPQQYEQSRRYSESLTPGDIEALQRETGAQMVRMAGFLAAAAAPGAPEVQAEIEEHYRGVCRFWTPDAAAYRGLGRMYADDERFRANYEKVAPGLAQYFRDAMAVYADTRLDQPDAQ